MLNMNLTIPKGQVLCLIHVVVKRLAEYLEVLKVVAAK
jgi:hypothetical protein